MAVPVFIEVKYRPDDRISTDLRAVTGDKRTRMRRAAKRLMANLPPLPGCVLIS